MLWWQGREDMDKSETARNSTREVVVITSTWRKECRLSCSANSQARDVLNIREMLVSYE
jgi:hypothetical protein